MASVGRTREGERLWITDIETRTRLRVGDQPAAHPDWLDDNRVAYLSQSDDHPGKTSVEVMHVGSGRTLKWTELEDRATGLAVHPSGRALAFISSASEGGQQIVWLDPLTGVKRVLAHGGEYDALRWRPDGSTLAWSGPAVGGNSASNGIWIAELGGSSTRRPGDGHPEFDLDVGVRTRHQGTSRKRRPDRLASDLSFAETSSSSVKVVRML